ncbi:hypothetical protein ASG22_19060 [Chryseobacterium sp. Leaf405]|uniref:hypothetical protein n=1 Tax=Chryseobacterium sp. Leaf405 TaxID=1736367 RepID=UPI0006F56B14|nr:hypothetical protein [Chryseobacterium sp. Leaf405]KQT31134.1 hypothetical protein ASG22_19060 [Chryseobacterium sp. Leaf405]
MKNVVKLSLFCIPLALASCKKEDIVNSELKEVAASMNKMTPQILSDGVRLDSVSAQPGKTLRYNYTLTDDIKENVTPAEIESFKKESKAGALKVIKTSAEIKEFRDREVTMEYVYYDKNGKKTSDFKISPNEYK